MSFDKSDYRCCYSLRTRIKKMDNPLELRQLMYRHRALFMLHSEGVFETFKEKIDELALINQGDGVSSRILEDCEESLSDMIEEYKLLSEEEKRNLRYEDNNEIFSTTNPM